MPGTASLSFFYSLITSHRPSSRNTHPHCCGVHPCADRHEPLCCRVAGPAPPAGAQALQDTPWSDEATCDGYTGAHVTSLAHRETLSLVEAGSR